ncbi:MAG: LysM peptidoglycan-binding domain-containing protein, partial [Treponema sp.]|nr:LysM peptidoglycan-binding domain-containing protein [Treponema sp.]
MKFRVTLPDCGFLRTVSGGIKDLLRGLAGAVYNNLFVPRAAFIICAGLLGAGAVFLVSFALMSPELPPGNMVSVLNGADSVPEGSHSDMLVLPPEDQDWAALSAWSGHEEQTGAGTAETDRSIDFDYRIRPGETLSEIAYAYSIPLDVLAHYNRIGNPDKIR